MPKGRSTGNRTGGNRTGGNRTGGNRTAGNRSGVSRVRSILSKIGVGTQITVIYDSALSVTGTFLGFENGAVVLRVGSSVQFINISSIHNVIL